MRREAGVPKIYISSYVTTKFELIQLPIMNYSTSSVTNDVIFTSIVRRPFGQTEHQEVIHFHRCTVKKNESTVSTRVSHISVHCLDAITHSL